MRYGFDELQCVCQHNFVYISFVITSYFRNWTCLYVVEIFQHIFHHSISYHSFRVLCYWDRWRTIIMMDKWIKIFDMCDLFEHMMIFDIINWRKSVKFSVMTWWTYLLLSLQKLIWYCQWLSDVKLKILHSTRSQDDSWELCHHLHDDRKKWWSTSYDKIIYTDIYIYIYIYISW